MDEDETVVVLPRRGGTTVRVVAGEVAEYYDVHGDTPPGHDDHSDDVYYDHSDDTYGDGHADDQHYDDSDEFVSRVGNPIDLISITVQRLTDTMADFAAQQQAQLSTHSGHVLTRLDSIEARLNELSRSLKPEE